MSLVKDKHAIGVGAIIQNDEGKVLLIQRKGPLEAGKWGLVGGHVDFKEKLTDALLREIKEETNLDVEEVRFFTYKEVIRHDIPAHYLVFLFTAKPKHTNIVACEHEVSNHGWFSYDEIKEMDIAFSDHLLFKKFFEEQEHKPGYLVETTGRW